MEEGFEEAGADRSIVGGVLAITTFALLMCSMISTSNAADILKRAGPDHYILRLKDVPVSRFLELLQANHGFEVKGADNIENRTLTTQFEGNLSEIVRRVFNNESYTLSIHQEPGFSDPKVFKITFLTKSDGTSSVERVASVIGNSGHAFATDSTVLDPLREGQPPIPSHVREAISPPPRETREREKFDKVRSELSKDLNDRVRRLKSLTR